MYLDKADAFLAEAETARAHGGLDRSLAHNMCYAAYHAASGLLAQLGHEYRKHRETLQAFDLESIPNPKKLREMHDRVKWLVSEIKRVVEETPSGEQPPEQNKLF